MLPTIRNFASSGDELETYTSMTFPLIRAYRGGLDRFYHSHSVILAYQDPFDEVDLNRELTVTAANHKQIDHDYLKFMRNHSGLPKLQVEHACLIEVLTF